MRRFKRLLAMTLACSMIAATAIHPECIVLADETGIIEETEGTTETVEETEGTTETVEETEGTTETVEETEGTTETTETTEPAEEPTEVHQHVYGEPQWTWVEATEENEVPYCVTATYVCAECLDEQIVDAEVVLVEEIPVSEVEPGRNVYTATVDFMEVSYSDTKDVITEPIAITDENAEITFSEDEYVYDGTEHTPEILVKINGVEVTKDSDYQVSYENAINAGTAKVVVTGMEAYSGSVEKEYVIKKAVPTIEACIDRTQIEVGTYAQITVTGTSEQVLYYIDPAFERCATVNDEGLVKGRIESGNVSITVSVPESANYFAWEQVIDIEVVIGNTRPELGMGSQDINHVYYYYFTPSVTAYYQFVSEFQDTEHGTPSIEIEAPKGTSYESIAKQTAAKDQQVNLVCRLEKGVQYRFDITYAYYRNDSGKDQVDTRNYKMNSKYYAAPTKKVTNVSDGIDVSWNEMAGAGEKVTYYIYRQENGGVFERLASTAQTSFRDKTVKSGSSYKYCIMPEVDGVLAEFNGGDSVACSDSLTYLKKTTTTLSNTSKGIKVSWKKITGAKGYYIKRKTGTGSYTTVKKITSGSTTTYTDTSIGSKNGKKYTYAVIPYNGSYNAAYSGKDMIRLSSVKLTSAKKKSKTSLTAKWAKNKSCSGYEIQYSKDKEFKTGVKTKKITKKSTLSSKISSLSKSKTYYVRVRCYKKSGSTNYYSAWSATKKVNLK